MAEETHTNDEMGEGVHSNDPSASVSDHGAAPIEDGAPAPSPDEVAHPSSAWSRDVLRRDRSVVFR